MDKIEEFIRSELADRLVKAETAVAKLKNENTIFASSSTYTIRVRIDSLWADRGEKSVTMEGGGTVKEVMKEAIEKFKKINERSDVQGAYDVRVILPHGTSLSLPEKLWRRYKYKHKTI